MVHHGQDQAGQRLARLDATGDGEPGEAGIAYRVQQQGGRGLAVDAVAAALVLALGDDQLVFGELADRAQAGSAGLAGMPTEFLVLKGRRRRCYRHRRKDYRVHDRSHPTPH